MKHKIVHKNKIYNKADPGSGRPQIIYVANQGIGFVRWAALSDIV